VSKTDADAAVAVLSRLRAGEQISLDDLGLVRRMHVFGLCAGSPFCSCPAFAPSTYCLHSLGRQLYVGEKVLPASHDDEPTGDAKRGGKQRLAPGRYSVPLSDDAKDKEIKRLKALLSSQGQGASKSLSIGGKVAQKSPGKFKSPYSSARVAVAAAFSSSAPIAAAAGTGKRIMGKKPPSMSPPVAARTSSASASPAVSSFASGSARPPVEVAGVAANRMRVSLAAVREMQGMVYERPDAMKALGRVEHMWTPSMLPKDMVSLALDPDSAENMY